MSDLARRLSDATALVFGELGFDAAHAAVRRSDRPDLADFQCNGALAIAKAAGRKPVEIARSVAQAWTATAIAEKPTIVGPGFLNYRVLGTALSARAQEIAGDPRSGASAVERRRSVLIDYGGPNVAKPMHVGHLRASIIGESLKRIFRFRGDEVLGDVHFGDWGFQMGLLIVCSPRTISAGLDACRAGSMRPARAGSTSLEDLDRMYPASRGSSQVGRRVSRSGAQGDSSRCSPGDPPPHAHLAPRCTTSPMVALKRGFDALGVNFDLWNGESDADPYIRQVIEDLKSRGLLEHDQGAQIVRVARPADKRELPPLLVISSEGSAMYGTTDLATILQRERDHRP